MTTNNPAVLFRTRRSQFLFSLILGAVLGWLALVIPGCGTVKGIASDMHWAADGIQNAMTEQRRNGN